MPEQAHHQLWNAEALWEQLEPLLPGISIEVLARCDSTNTALLERVRSDVRASHDERSYGRRSHDLQACLLVAEHQTAGRGRLGRAWQSAPGSSLTFSLGLPLDMSDWSGLSLAVGCAIADALEPLDEALQTPRLQLKWPNDLWLDGRKLGGILIETVPAGGQRMVIVGVGLNVSELGGVNESQFGTGFAALDEYQPGLSAPALLARIAPALVQTLLDFPARGFAAWQPAYARRDLTLGRAVTAGPLEGISRGVNASGELLLETAAGRLQPVSGGEVSVRLAPAAPPTPLA